MSDDDFDASDADRRRLLLAKLVMLQKEERSLKSFLAELRTQHAKLKIENMRLNEILEDPKPEKIVRLQNQEADLDLPGDGQFYCVECNRYFIDQATRTKHIRTKVHKQRLKALKAPAYTQKVAEAADGLGTDD